MLIDQYFLIFNSQLNSKNKKNHKTIYFSIFNRYNINKTTRTLTNYSIIFKN